MVPASLLVQILQRGILLSLVVLFLSSAAFAQITAKVYGSVKDKSGAVIAGARVSISSGCICSSCTSECSCCPGSISVTTGDSGMYEFVVQDGEYDVTAGAIGYSSTTVHVIVRDGQNQEVNMTLSRAIIALTKEMIFTEGVNGALSFFDKKAVSHSRVFSAVKCTRTAETSNNSAKIMLVTWLP